MRLGRLVPIIAAATLAGCSTSPNYPQPQPRPARNPPARAVSAVSAATYVAQASSIDLFVIKSSQLALTRSASGAIRNVASRLIAAHEGLGSQLSFAGRRLDLLPSAALLPQHQAMLDELQSSGNFDATYLRQQRAIHGAAYSLHSNYAARGTSPTLRPVATNAAAVERSHLDMLRRL
jgi:putative membrane protein